MDEALKFANFCAAKVIQKRGTTPIGEGTTDPIALTSGKPIFGEDTELRYKLRALRERWGVGKQACCFHERLF